MALEPQKKDLEDCPQCKERALVLIDRWGTVKRECLNCDYEELVAPSWKNPNHKATAKAVF